MENTEYRHLHTQCANECFNGYAVINGIVEASVALNRLRSFFLCDEHHPIGPDGLEDIGIRIENLSAVYDSKRPPSDESEDSRGKEIAEKNWEMTLLKAQLEDAERRIRELSATKDPKVGDDDTFSAQASSLLCLSRINFECRPGELIAVVGGVGCSKTSFMNSILGEVRALSGQVAVKGSLAYFSQTPFVMNASVRDNILFGHLNETVNENLYQRALSCCALRHDLKLLPDGELTEIGEKGITLSGGQKARVALARAIYHNGDITLIDDALSAVDAHVAKQLFEEAILKELLESDSGRPERSVVLVTNSLQFLNHPRVDRIIVLREGRIVEEGTYTYLASQPDSIFARFLAVLKETDVSGTLNEGSDTRGEDHVSPVQRRRSSHRNIAPESPERTAKKLISEETREIGHVGLSVYLSWCRAAGGLFVPIVILLSFAVTEGISILSNWWLTYWSEHADYESQRTFLAIYACINLVAAVTGLLRMLVVIFFSLKASRKVRRMEPRAVVTSDLQSC